MKYIVKILFTTVLIISCKNLNQEVAKKNDRENPGSKELYYKSQADSFYNRNQFTNAVIYYDSAIQLDTMNGENYCRRGYSNDMIYKQPGLKIAVSDYLRSIKLGYKEETCYFNLGVSYIFLNDSVALDYLNKCYKLNPNHPHVSELIANCETRMSKKEHMK